MAVSTFCVGSGVEVEGGRLVTVGMGISASFGATALQDVEIITKIKEIKFLLMVFMVFITFYFVQ